MVLEEHDIPAVSAGNALHDDVRAEETRKDMFIRHWRRKDKANGAVKALAGQTETKESLQVWNRRSAEHRQHVQQRSSSAGRETEEERHQHDRLRQGNEVEI